MLEHEGSGWRRQTLSLEQEDRKDAKGPGGSQWQHAQPPEPEALSKSPSGMCWLPAACRVPSCMSRGEYFLLWLLLPTSFLSQFHCGNEASDSWICDACLGTGDITCTRILVADLRNSPVILKWWCLSSKDHLNFTLSRVKKTGNFKAAMLGPLAIQTHLS